MGLHKSENICDPVMETVEQLGAQSQQLLFMAFSFIKEYIYLEIKGQKWGKLSHYYM